MSVIEVALRQVHIFMAGFAISAACLMMAGMVAGYPSEKLNDLGGGFFEVSADD